jgi:hypothetical protein
MAPYFMLAGILAIIAIINVRRFRAARRDGVNPFRPSKVIVAFWLLLGIAVIALLFWSPKK